MGKKQKKQAPKKRTFIGLVLDTSWSMDSIRQQAITLFNDQLTAAQAGAKEAGTEGLSLVLFGFNDDRGHMGAEFGSVRVIHNNVAPEAVPLLTAETYKPENGTPMRDGIGQMIELLEPKDDGGADTAFLVVIVTDGQENQSVKWGSEALSAKIAALQKTGRWTFAVFGADGLDLEKLKETAGLATLDATSFVAYTPDPAGVAQASMGNVGAMHSFTSSRSAGRTSSAYGLDAADIMSDTTGKSSDDEEKVTNPKRLP